MQTRPHRRFREQCAAALLAFAAIPATASLGAQEPEQRRPDSRQTTLGVDYSYAYFEGDIEPWHLGAFSLGQSRTAGSLTARINMARRFGTAGAQFEVDAYPGLGKNTYAYLNVGYSRSGIFPGWRFGGEAFRSLPRAFEASAGFRQLRFGGPPVTLFTGSVGKYSGNYWFSLRPYVRDKPTGLSASASLTARRYYADADNYVGGRVGYGSSPNDNVIAEQLARASSLTAGLHGSRNVSSRTIGTWLLGFEREELSVDRLRTRWEIGGGVKFRY